MLDLEEEAEEKSEDNILRVKEKEGEFGLSSKGGTPLIPGDHWLFPDY